MFSARDVVAVGHDSFGTKYTFRLDVHRVFFTSSGRHSGMRAVDRCYRDSAKRNSTHFYGDDRRIRRTRIFQRRYEHKQNSSENVDDRRRGRHYLHAKIVFDGARRSEPSRAQLKKTRVFMKLKFIQTTVGILPPNHLRGTIQIGGVL